MNQLQKLHQTEHTNYYSVYDNKGRKICDTASIQDAIMMCSFDSSRTYTQVKIILDQIVNIPSYKMEDDKQLEAQNILPERQEVPFSP